MRYLLSHQRQCKIVVRALYLGTANTSIIPTAGMSDLAEKSVKAMKEKFVYPVARKDQTIEDDFHGSKIKDVYRWLEDPDAAETQEYVNSQNNISQPFLENCEQWKKINSKLTKLWNYPKYGCPMQYGKYYYFFMNTGLQNQSVMYQQDSLHGESKVFLDPNGLSEDGTVALSQKSFSDDGKFMAYGLSESGSDWIKIRIRDAETGKDFDEVLEKVKFSEISWTKDNKGFFYGRYPDQDGKTDGSETKQNEHQKLYYHLLGQSQAKDVLVVQFPKEPSWRIQSKVSDCGKYLILAIVKDCRDNIIYYADLKPGEEIVSELDVKIIVDKFESDYDYVTNVGSKVYFRTNKNAQNYRIIIIDFENPGEANWETLIPEHEKDVLEWVKCVNEDKLLLCYIRDVKTILQANSLETGKLIRQFDLDIGTIVGTSGKKKYSEIFYNFSSFLNPGTIYHYDFKHPDEPPKVFREIKLNLDGFRREDYAVEQIFYSSKDGTKVPMFIIRKNKNVLEPRPCLLYGYGGFNISMLPTFGITGLMFVDTFDGVLAYPNIRGGGEYGEKWHNGGRLLNKQNVFDDFQCAAEYLINNKYTTKDRLAIQGGSNGGLLVGACINQRPDLFGAAVAQVGVMDMLRFHKFTIGHAWCSDYGNPSEKEHFDNLYKFSPLHNVHTPQNENKEYPSTLILTADHDDRVSPLHSLKFAAALQEAVRDSKHQQNPLLLRVYKKAGHGAGKPTSKRIEEATDILTFMYLSLKMDATSL
ncbi:prolyl endopeptidase isoform X2 [Drosophila grimshawi]|uniref:prolyl endopeptidase isoform X2 n=1 Tax=Drosophila grimshawi TaxID=7222 RepID=UPI000C86E7CA|nr:prolyl endopeptidase isoform X2 [Drosophila grimshawi]